MRSPDLRTLRQVLREAIAAQGRSNRKLEEDLGIGHGNIEKLLSGRAEIKVRHLAVLAELLDVPPADFLALGLPEATARARRRLTDWIAPEQRRAGGQAPQRKTEGSASQAVVQVSTEQLAELVREAVRVELAKHGVGAAVAPAGGGSARRD
jgi:transcriptional regulator with XRE-family HTH domain